MNSTTDLSGPLNSEERRYAPDGLYVAGHGEWLRQRPRVAVVGARKASAAGIRRAAEVTRALVAHGATVVSGLAEGVDSVAHRAAIEAGGRTIGVIGTPLSEAYPRQHRGLQQRLMRDHLVVSQFPVGHPTARRNFPLRNRLMALISDASVIVEAGDNSGSLSHGWEALRLGHPVLLMAAAVERQDLRWPRTMMDHGAMVLRAHEELLALLPAPVGDPLAAFE